MRYKFKCIKKIKTQSLKFHQLPEENFAVMTSAENKTVLECIKYVSNLNDAIT